MSPMDLVQAFAPYATKEVLTVLGAMLTAWIGWKAAAKSFGLVSSVAMKFSFLGLAATVMVLAGLGGTGIGIGELITRISNQPSTSQPGGTLEGDHLVTLTEKCQDPEVLKLVLQYAEHRDGTVAQLTDKELTKVATNGKENKLVVMALLDHLANKPVRSDTPSPALTVLEAKVKANESATVRADEKVQKESLLSLPWTFGLISTGIGSCICGIFAYRWRTRQLCFSQGVVSNACTPNSK